VEDQLDQQVQQVQLVQPAQQAFVELLEQLDLPVQQARHQLFKDQQVQQARRERQSMFAEALQQW
jgi:hypothetical protein